MTTDHHEDPPDTKASGDDPARDAKESSDPGRDAAADEKAKSPEIDEESSGSAMDGAATGATAASKQDGSADSEATRDSVPTVVTEGGASTEATAEPETAKEPDPRIDDEAWFEAYDKPAPGDEEVSDDSGAGPEPTSPKDAAGPKSEERFVKPPDELFDLPPDREDLDAMTRWEPEATPGSLRAIIPNKKLRWTVLAAIPVLALAFGSGLIAVSHLKVTHSLQVFGVSAGKGPSTARELRRSSVKVQLVSGAPNALRVSLWNRRKKVTEKHFRARLTLYGPKGPHRLFTGPSGPGTAVEANFQVPRLKPGGYKLGVEAWHGKETIRARLPVALVGSAHRRAPVPIEKVPGGKRFRATKPDADGVVVELLPSSGPKVFAELRERMTVRSTTRDGRPVRAALTTTLRKGLLQEARVGRRVVPDFQTDALGLFAFRFHSRHPYLDLTARYRLLQWGDTEDVRWRTYTFDQRRAHAQLHPDRLVLKPGQAFGAGVHLLAKSDSLYVDLWVRGHLTRVWSQDLKQQKGRLALQAPRSPGLCRLQASNDFLNPGTGVTSRTLFIDAEGLTGRETLVRLARAVLAELLPGDRRTRRHIQALLAGQLLTRTDIDRRRAAAYLLSRLDRLHHRTAWLADTSASDQTTLSRRRRRMRIFLIAGIVLTALLLLAVVVPMVVSNTLIARRGHSERDKLMAEFHQETGVEHSGDFRPPVGVSPVDDPRHHRLQHVVQSTAIVLVFLATVVGILLLLGNLSWGW